MARPRGRQKSKEAMYRTPKPPNCLFQPIFNLRERPHYTKQDSKTLYANITYIEQALGTKEQEYTIKSMADGRYGGVEGRTVQVPGSGAPFLKRQTVRQSTNNEVGANESRIESCKRRMCSCNPIFETALRNYIVMVYTSSKSR